MDQSPNTAAKMIAAMQTEEFFLACRSRADRDAFLRILNRQSGEPPSPEDAWETPASR
jgi:hypothetical protein